MAKFLQWLGAIWACVGFFDLAMLPWQDATSFMITAAVILNGCLFILPGLALYGLGVLIAKPHT